MENLPDSSPPEPDQPSPQKQRAYGIDHGKVRIADDFGEFPPELEREFFGPIEPEE